jgi:hypothetical protein
VFQFPLPQLAHGGRLWTDCTEISLPQLVQE